MGFYGLNIHMWSTYVDIFSVRAGLLQYSYRLLPHFPFSVALDAALFPVVSMLVYQWTLKHNKNFYLYAMSAVFVSQFIFAPILVNINFFHLHKGLNYLHLFIINVAIVLLSKVITNIFLNLHKRLK